MYAIPQPFHLCYSQVLIIIPSAAFTGEGRVLVAVAAGEKELKHPGKL